MSCSNNKLKKTGTKIPKSLPHLNSSLLNLRISSKTVQFYINNVTVLSIHPVDFGKWWYINFFPPKVNVITNFETSTLTWATFIC